jgi:hypothetical protein
MPLLAYRTAFSLFHVVRILGMRMVRTDVLLLAFAQVSILDAMCHGVDRKTATDMAYGLYYDRLAPEQDRRNRMPESAALMAMAAEVKMADAAARRLIVDAVQAMDDARPPLTWRYDCLANSASVGATMLRVPPFRPGTGSALDAAEVDRIGWLLETVRRVAEGQPYLEAARAAHDAYLGKPRQKRCPVENAWLAEQVTAALEAIWPALVASPRGASLPAAWPCLTAAEGR